jgi:hypothetical protein
MRDEAFSKPMSPPRTGKVVRLDPADGGFFDVAIKFAVTRLDGRYANPRPAPRAAAAAPVSPAAGVQSRMQNLGIALGEVRRGGRRG